MVPQQSCLACLTCLMEAASLLLAEETHLEPLGVLRALLLGWEALGSFLQCSGMLGTSLLPLIENRRTLTPSFSQAPFGCFFTSGFNIPFEAECRREAQVISVSMAQPVRVTGPVGLGHGRGALEEEVPWWSALHRCHPYSEGDRAEGQASGLALGFP